MPNVENTSGARVWWLPYLIFGLVALLVFFVSLVLTIFGIQPYAGLFLNISAALLAVVLVEFLWRVFGGEPIVQAIVSLRTSVRQLRELESSGVTSVKIRRRELTEQAQVDQWVRMLETATKVDLMAFSTRDFFRESKLVKGLEDAIARNLCQVRVITYERPIGGKSMHILLLQRMNEEELVAPGAQNRMTGRLEETWAHLQMIATKFRHDPQRCNSFQMQVATRLMIRASIVRIDNQMWVSSYLSSCVGGDSPALQLLGPDSPLFQRYLNEFDHMWKYATPP